MARQACNSGVRRNSGANQRSRMASDRLAMPPASMAAMRVCHICGSPIRAAVFDSTSARSRSGRRAASPWPIMPPMERPTNTRSRRPSCSIRVSASSTRTSIRYGPSGQEDSPWPRLSNRISRRPAGSFGMILSQSRKSVPSELANSTGTPSGSPSSRQWTRADPRSATCICRSSCAQIAIPVLTCKMINRPESFPKSA